MSETPPPKLYGAEVLSAPMQGVEPDTIDLIIADLGERKQLGRDRYGVAHQSDNGRPHPVDLYHELMDGLVYVRAWIAERERMVARIAELEAQLRLACTDFCGKCEGCEATSKAIDDEEQARRTKT